jgi:aspartyl protease family protein
MKIILLFTLIVLFSYCKHPEAKKFERNNSNSIKLYSDYTINNDLIENEDQTTTISMREESGVYFVPIEINGVNMEFVFDTGASSISISENEALFLLKQGKLSENDFIGEVQFSDANGDISEGTIVNLKSVKIGDKVVYNVKASIVHNQIAPLLFGQSAMNRFGKITIDYNNNEITFN